ncbi:hypothetical protein [Sulfuricurvum sp.]|uniref:hypothetical protein n=1 Tax=Sulfuricurvum sp. TaxID=2025608 RepID=UPI00260F9F78|nr:hypothetical protein [Sulfuricurvum sp.]MDD2267064.1 hypothetical protein [Sulfuricurvum sp.]
MKNDHLPFEEARAFVRNVGLQNAREWKLWSKGELQNHDRRPDFIPSNPDIVYKRSGWLGWSDWLKEVKEQKYLPFEQAKEFVHSLNLKNNQEWIRYYQGKLEGVEKPDYIPWNPQIVYKSDWIGIKDWLGTSWRDFKEAREFVRNLGLGGTIEWRAYCQGVLEGYDSKPSDIPTDPARIYENDGFVDMGDWLGTGRKRKTNYGIADDTWLTYEEAKSFVHTLGLSGYDQWREYIDDKYINLPIRPDDIPRSPQYVYKNDGWVNWNDWIGNTVNHKQYKNIEDEEYGENTHNILFSLNEIAKEYGDFKGTLRILEKLLASDTHYSIIELDINSDIASEIERIFFGFRTLPSRQSLSSKAFTGFIFLAYVVLNLKDQLQHAIWKPIIDELDKYASINTFFKDNYFLASDYPNLALKDAILIACKTFNLRNDFDNKDDHQYLRNTILLQIGMFNESFTNVKMWLSNYNIPIVIAELLDHQSSNYSHEFDDGWRALRRYRDNLITSEQMKSFINPNPWFKHIDLDGLLKAAKQKNKRQLIISTEENMDVFYLSHIHYDEMGLHFTVNAQDTYMLNLGGYRYEIFLDDDYAGLLLADANKRLVLDSPIILNNPSNNRINLEIRNEDHDTIYSTQIILFDFSEQLIIFDEDGEIHSNIFKKLNSTKKYNLLMDADLDCSFNQDNQREYFEGFATLIPNIRAKDDCKIFYNDDFLFELNFSETVNKPDFFDEIVLYTTSEKSFIIDENYTFLLKRMHVDPNTDEVDLQSLPEEVQVIKWTYSGGYADKDEIEENTMTAPLYAEMVTSPKHTLILKYHNKVFKKVVYCNFFERAHLYRLFEINKQGDTRQVGRQDILNRHDLKNNRYFLSDMNHSDKLYFKNKSYFYQKIIPNTTINFSKLSGFGESIFVSEHLYNSELIELFHYHDSQEYMFIKNGDAKTLYFYKHSTAMSKLIILDGDYNYHEFSMSEIEGKSENSQFRFDFEIVTCLLVSGSHLIDSCSRNDFLKNKQDIDNVEIMKNLLAANYIFLVDDAFTQLFRRFVLSNPEESYSLLYSDSLKINNQHVVIDFFKQKLMMEHILMSVVLDKEKSEKVLQGLILAGYENKLLETPIILFNLLKSASAKRLIGYFYGMVEEAVIEDEIDESFVQRIVDHLFDTTTVKSRDKHNLKVAMHYINGEYYLKKALEELLNG